MQYNQALYGQNPSRTILRRTCIALWQDIAENSFLNWYVNEQMPQDAVDDFIAIDDVDETKTPTGRVAG